ncbi:conserved membrane protein of unknown function [Thauera humireducens]|uniref:lysylphosphatidylglycerol synthase transmembrane domain-containing protein n=1 Tax=Thauera humireducens TaxID=1134435 RepID=UPI002467AAA8|nr:lysylphosphatidylglycerol synthase transmembrane domain-containing protein [Thauera humireducens]CAH1749129.1 conserved membrane protein of unknown function [Thauera humireducens]
MPASRRLAARLLPALGSLALLAAVFAWLDDDALAATLVAPSPGWLAAALLLGVPQMALSAWRWQLTAQRLDAPLPFGRAVAEYYLGSFLNQVLPGGVLGDASRAWRHARIQAAASHGPRAAWLAVVLERASGQFALLLIALATLLVSPMIGQILGRAFAGIDQDTSTASLPVRLALIGAALVLLLFVLRRSGLLRHLANAGQRALLARDALWRQLLASLAISASYIAVYFCCARMLGIDTPATTLLALIPWVLLAMALPLSLAGWGLREGAAALLWAAAELDVAQGVAISISYGLVVLLSTLPGAWVLARRAP